MGVRGATPAGVGARAPPAPGSHRPPPRQLALVILMVSCIHVIEAYGLNPAIYSAHLKLHPLLVLAALVVAEHSVGVWGLLLAVPTTVFVLDYAIRWAREGGGEGCGNRVMGGARRRPDPRASRPLPAPPLPPQLPRLLRRRRGPA